MSSIFDNPQTKEILDKAEDTLRKLGIDPNIPVEELEDQDDVRDNEEPVYNQTIDVKDLLSTGSSTFNLACSGRVEGGFLKGKYYFIIGDSSSGKTWLSLTCFAEACKNKEFDNYRLIFDDAEGSEIDIERFFGKKVSKRIEFPRGTRENPECSTSLEEFYFNLDNALSHKQPCIYVLDSMDALDVEEDEAKFNERKEAYEKGKSLDKLSGSYGVAKAKMNSTNMRREMHKLANTGSILIVLSQTRDRIGFGAQFDPRTRSGGRALKFYATLEMWSSVREALKSSAVNGKEREQGIICKIEVKKNKLNGRRRVVEIPIYHSYGIDDVGGCIDYLIEEKHWAKANKIDATELGVAFKYDKLANWIDENNKVEELHAIVQKVWDTVERKSSVNRKRRYE